MPATRPWATTSCSPAPRVSGAIILRSAVSSATGASITGQKYSQTWLEFIRLPGKELRALRIASMHPAIARSAWGSEVICPAASRTMDSSRTWASATSRTSASFSGATQR